MATILAGKPIADATEQEVRDLADAFAARTGFRPTLAAVLVGEDAASQVYVRNKERACARAGIESRVTRLPASTAQADLLNLIASLNEDPLVHGILVQLPLPSHLDARTVLDAIDPLKDVDGFHPYNAGLLLQGRPRFVPCTPLGIIDLLRRHSIDITGKHAVVVGRSDIVGKPMAALLGQKEPVLPGGPANATVTMCHSRSENLREWTRSADLLVVAIGRPQAIRADHVKPGAIVIDVGINRTPVGLVGDVDFDSVSPIAGAITPVPGGVGRLTVAMLLRNTMLAAQGQYQEAPTP